MNTLKMSWWFRNEATCCETHGPCNQGRDCPARQPAEAATEIGCDDDPRWLDCVTPRTGALIVALSAAVVIAIALGSAL